MSKEEKHMANAVIAFLDACIKEIGLSSPEDEFSVVSKNFNDSKAALKDKVDVEKERLHALFAFVEKAFGEENEMLLLLTELTVHDKASRFIALFGCDDYQTYSKHMMVTNRQDALLQEIDELEI